MASTVASRRGHSEVNDGDPQGTLGLVGEARAAAPSTWSDDEAKAALWFLQIVDRAMERTAPRKVICATMRVDKSLLRRWLDGDGHLSAARLGLLGQDFWLNVAEELRLHFGLIDRAEMAAQGEALIDRGRQLLAKAAHR